MSAVESILFWVAAVIAAGSFIVALIAIIFKKSFWLDLAQYMLLASFALISTLGIIRWSSTGHPPFVTLFESMLTSIWFLWLIQIVGNFISSRMRILVLPVALIGFLMLGWASSFSDDAGALSLALTNTWLFIHASFATAGASAFLAAASFGVIYLMGEQRFQESETLKARVPQYNKIPTTMTNLLILGLILWSVMIVSGSIWANAAWGRYWAWDPIELWSLISWLMYGLLLHARITFKLSKRLFSLLAIATVFAVLFALWGVGYVYETIHEYG